MYCITITDKYDPTIQGIYSVYVAWAVLLVEMSWDFL
jgi:hypothetical protein